MALFGAMWSLPLDEKADVLAKMHIPWLRQPIAIQLDSFT
jgi:hypothetical protein